MSVLAFIPAKGTSRRLPRKNILPLGGRPMLAWSILVAQQSGLFDRIVVSTECPEIAGIARANGAEVPFLRPADLSESAVTNHQVLIHLLDRLRKQDGYFPDFVMTLQPTSPLRQVQDIRAAMQLAVQNAPASIVSVDATEIPGSHFQTLDETGRVAAFAARPGGVHRLNGAIALAPTVALLESPDPYANAVALLMPAHRSVDIDTTEDLEIARALVAHFKP